MGRLMLCCASYAEGHTNLGAIRGHIYISYQITMILNLHLSTQKHRYLFRCPNSFLRVIDTSHMPSNIIFLIPPFFPSFQTASPTPREINSARLCPTQDFVFPSNSFPLYPIFLLFLSHLTVASWVPFLTFSISSPLFS